MRKHIAVIGSSFGDEGKGQFVDYFSSKREHRRVVRFNGGSQAGHTVVTPSGHRHVFSQLGSGSFCGIQTHLSRFMYINPVYLMREISHFRKNSGLPVKISIDPRAQLIFESDIKKQQYTETTRTEPHGSTGHGVFNAIQRHLTRPECGVTIQEFLNVGCYNLQGLADRIDDYYGNKQSKLWIEELNNSLNWLFFSEDNNLEIGMDFDEDVVNRYDCIFEGAQGLLLDQNSGMFPHVTPSNTGLTNVISILSGSDDNEYQLKPVYVTRSFLTRHGNGPMYFSKFDDIYNYDIDHSKEDFSDETNVYNRWQGSMRYGKLNKQQLKNTINRDYNLARQQVSDTARLDPYSVAMTWAHLESQQNSIEDICSVLPVDYLSYTPTRDKIFDAKQNPKNY